MVSGRGEAGLRAQAERLLAYVRSGSAGVAGVDVVGVGRALVVSRAVFEHRAVLLGSDVEALVGQLEGVAAGEVAAGVVRGQARPGGGRPVFVFPGQGAQWAGMGAELLEVCRPFAEVIAECEAALAPWVEWSLAGVLRQEAGAPSLERVDVVQPVSFAVMVALAGVWRAAGVEPAAVVGHSQGEIAAACVAGALSLEDAARVVALRSQLIARKLAGQGGMLSVAQPLAEVSAQLQGLPGGGVEVAAVNGPRSVVIAGRPDVLEELLAGYEAAGVRARRIAVDYASHTSQVEAMRRSWGRRWPGSGRVCRGWGCSPR